MKHTKTTAAIIVVLVVLVLVVAGVIIYAVYSGVESSNKATSSALTKDDRITVKQSTDNTDDVLDRRDGQIISDAKPCDARNLSAQLYSPRRTSEEKDTAYKLLEVKNKTRKDCTLYGSTKVVLQNEDASKGVSATEVVDFDIGPMHKILLSPGKTAIALLTFPLVQAQSTLTPCKDGMTTLGIRTEDLPGAITIPSPYHKACEGFSVSQFTDDLPMVEAVFGKYK